MDGNMVLRKLIRKWSVVEFIQVVISCISCILAL